MIQPFVTAAARQRNAYDIAMMNESASVSMGASKVGRGDVRVTYSNMEQRLESASYVIGLNLSVQSAIIGEIQRLIISFVQEIKETRLYAHTVKTFVNRLRAAADDLKRASEESNRQSLEYMCRTTFGPYTERFMAVAGNNLEARLQMRFRSGIDEKLVSQRYCIKNWMDQKNLKESALLSTLLLADNLTYVVMMYSKLAFEVASEKCYIGRHSSSKVGECVRFLTRNICRAVCGNDCDILKEYEAHHDEFVRMEECSDLAERSVQREKLKPFRFSRDVSRHTDELTKFMTSSRMKEVIDSSVTDTRDDFIAFAVYALRASSSFPYPVVRTLYEVLGQKENIRKCLRQISALPLSEYEDDGDLLDQGLDAPDPEEGTALYDFGRLLATGKCIQPIEDPIAVMAREMRRSARKNGGHVAEHLLASLYVMSGNRKSYVEDMLRKAGLKSEATRLHHQPVSEIRAAVERLRSAFIQRKGVRGWEDEMARISAQMQEINAGGCVEQDRKKRI